jgi:glycosyltransferase involved in cell wall biosynthesis
MKIVHFPTWYPTNNNAVEGIFNQRLIFAINKFDNNEHIIVTWHHNKIAKLKNPIIFILHFIKSFLPYKVLEDRGVKIVEINYLITNEFFFGKNINRLIKKIDFAFYSLKLSDSAIIYHAHVAYPGAFIAQQLAIRHNIPYVITEHMGPFPFENLKKDLFEKVISPFKQASQVVAVSSFLANQIEQLVGINLQVIPNVVRNISFNFSKKKIPLSVFKFVIVARIEVEKGIEVLFDAIEILLKTRTNFRVDIYGEGEMKQYFMKKAISKNINRNINWLDSLNPSNVQNTIVNYNCLMSSSLYESFGVTLIEALSVGVPIIASDCGGPKDIVNEINGILVPNNNPVEFAVAMNTMINTYYQYSKERIIEDCFNRFSDKIISEKYNLIYNHIIQTQLCVE